MPTIIALNGPPKIGKGWLSFQITNYFRLDPIGKKSDVQVRIMSFAEPLRQEVLRRERWQGTYDEFKEHVFSDGLTGREKLIELGTTKRAEDIHYWSRQLTESHLFRSSQLVIIDDLGFRDELDWLAASTSDLITIVMAPSQYSIGCRYHNDSRECVAPRGGFRTTDSSRALELFKEFWSNRQANADSQTPIASRLGSENTQRTADVGRPLVKS